ncbi:hypothetical protein AB0H69_07495 [Streptomyces phaeochromogenes]|uniref:DUF6907 domain-containing protein n=1 Tax=Streptomyces phaeochromogenes TaxID=1923 RepID=UPI0033CE2952
MSNLTRNPYGLMATPALDLTPTGHLPHLVDQARPHPDTEQPLTGARTWTYLRQSDRAPISVTCPTWCESTHEMDQYLTQAPEDIQHSVHGREVTVKATANGTYEDWRILGAQLAIAPDSEEPERRAPYVQVEIADEVWSRPMGAGELADFIGTVEGQLAELRKLHTGLVQVRAEHAHTVDVLTIIRERQATATGPLAEVMDAMASLVEKTGDPDSVAELVLGLTVRARAELLAAEA